jgi:5'-3' exonuclease
MEGRVRGEVRFSDVKDILGVTPAYVADFLALAGDEADGIPRIVTPSRARELIRSRGHVRDWIDRDLRVAPSLREKVEEGREQLRLNLALVDLSADAVGDVPAPLLDGWDDAERARAIGERTDVTWLAAEDVADEYAVLREWGAAARRRLGA